MKGVRQPFFVEKRQIFSRWSAAGEMPSHIVWGALAEACGPHCF